jgi:preprotein translocase subunit Sss1
MGSTGAAKEALNFVAISGAGLTLLGLTGALILIIKDGLIETA